MNLEHTPNHYHPPELFEEITYAKEEQLDRTTNLLNEQYPPSQDASPPRNNFFFTPNSPKHFHCFDFANHAEEEHQKTYKKDFQPSTKRPTIEQKIDFSVEEQISQIAGDCLEKADQERQNKARSTPNRSSKNSKGLRNLSESVYRIVSELAITKYKEVADRLIQEISAEHKEDNDHDKDQHNIKRRVYDALNVLIAADILRKQGKQVLCNEPYDTHRFRKSGRNVRQMLEKQKLLNQLIKRQEFLKQKQQKLQKLQEKKKLIEEIIKRNKNNNSLTLDEHTIFRFPLIGTVLTEKNLKITHQQEQVVFRTLEKPKLYGDVDLLMQISKETLEADTILNNICCPLKIETKLQETP